MLAASPVLGWCLTDDLVKSAAERSQAAETDLEADIGHAARALAQQEHRALDPAALQVTVRWLAKCRTERPDEVRLRDMLATSSGSAYARSIASRARSIRRLVSSTARLIASDTIASRRGHPTRPQQPAAMADDQSVRVAR